MKKISANLFFTVLWRGVCQALGWFFGLFGYKRDGSFAKCVWGLFALSASIITAFVALVIVCASAKVIYERYFGGHHCDAVECYHSEYVGRNIYFHNTRDGKGYIYNSLTGEKTLRNVTWIAKPLGKDSLVCFSNGKKRGYFSKNTGEVVIETKYDHAWVFSEGLASVEEDGVINFIDGSGKVVLDLRFPYFNGMDGYVFHDGYCVVYGDGLDTFGLIDKTGKTALPCLYNSINPTDEQGLWCLQKGKEMAVVDKQLQPVIPFMECDIDVSGGTINVTMPDHTIRMYDLHGNLVQDFCIAYTKTLEYEKEEVVYRDNILNNNTDSEIVEYLEECYHPKATAKMKSYVAGMGYEGLMTPDGHRVTMPIYEEIEAIGADTYLCTVADGKKVIINGKGEIIK